MKEAKTESEAVINQPPELKESLTEEGAPSGDIEPVISAEQEPAVLSDTEILANLQPKAVKKTAPSRKDKTIERSVKNYNKSLDEEGGLDFDVLLKEYDKNPKGLASFAESNGFELESLEDAIEDERNYIQSDSEKRIQELEDKLQKASLSKQTDDFQGTIKSLVEQSDLTLNEFNSTHGENFSLFVTAFQQQGKSLTESAELAFAKVVPARDSEKNELIETEKSLPLGKKVVKKAEIGLMKPAEVQALPDKERYAYKAKYRDPETKVVKYA